MHPPPGPRKRRTRQHVVADLSLNHVERHVLDAGHVVQRVAPDYGYDLMLMTFDDRGYAEPDVAFLQLKAAESLVRSGENYAYDLDIRDYNLWRAERLPVILVLYDATARRAYWVHVQQFFADNAARPPRTGAKTTRVLVHPRQVFNRRAVATMRTIKQAAILRIVRGTTDA